MYALVAMSAPVHACGQLGFFFTGKSMPRQSTEQLSELIGAIYDCAIDPALWPDTIGAIGGATDCFAGLIAVTDLQKSEARLVKTWGYDPAWLDRVSDYREEADELAELWKYFGSLPVGEPVSSRALVPSHVYEQSRYYNEWARPQGVVDSLHLVVLREPDRAGEFSLTRHERFGFIGDREFATLRLLAPHICRAIRISDLLDMKSLEKEALSATLDSVAAGIVVVAAEGRILHANDAARRMFEARSPVVSSRGFLTALHPQSTQELMRAIAIAQSDEARIGGAAIGVPLIGRDLAPATAHVLPLARGDLRTRLMPQATAAVFIAPPGTSLPPDLDAVAHIFGLTPAETRQLHRLVAGDSLAAAAKALGVSEATARSHRQHIFAKMGVSRHADVWPSLIG
jgi:DNA-binding CsgD family transcriptional regulator/PAS domain-containing protein